MTVYMYLRHRLNIRNMTIFVVNALSIMKSTCQNEQVNKSETDYVQCSPLSDSPTAPSAARPFTASSARLGRGSRASRLAICDEQKVATLPLTLSLPLLPDCRVVQCPIKWKAKDCLQRREDRLASGTRQREDAG